MFAHSRDPHPAIKLWCPVPLTKSKKKKSKWNILYAVLFEKQYIKNRTFNDKNRWIIKEVVVFKQLLPHLATRGTYSPGDWRCDEAWCEQTVVCHPVMCQQRLIYCTWELNVMYVYIYGFSCLWCFVRMIRMHLTSLVLASNPEWYGWIYHRVRPNLITKNIKNKRTANPYANCMEFYCT